MIMNIYIFFIYFNYINARAHNYIFRVPKSMSEKRMTPRFIRSFVPLKNMATRNRYIDVNDNEIQRLYREYMQPVHVLKEQFPNDIIEVQLEIEKSNQNDNMNQKPHQIIKVRKQPALRAVTPATKTAPRAALQSTLQANSKATLQAQSQPVSQSAAMAVLDKQTTAWTQEIQYSQVISQAQVENNNKKPVYKEDLDKAFSDFELKLSSTTTITSTDVNSATPVLRASTQPAPRPYNIDHIVEILKKGVLMQTHRPNPNDRDLHWIQIKIPKQ